MNVIQEKIQLFIFNSLHKNKLLKKRKKKLRKNVKFIKACKIYITILYFTVTFSRQIIKERLFPSLIRIH